MQISSSTVLLLSFSTLLSLSNASTYLNNLFYSRQTCSEGEVLCGVLCLQAGYTCCPSQDRGCQPGFECQLGSNGQYGCCLEGEVCSGDGSVTQDPSIETAADVASGVSVDSFTAFSLVVTTPTTVAKVSARGPDISSTAAGSGKSTVIGRRDATSSTIGANASSAGSYSSSGAAAGVHRSSPYDNWIKFGGIGAATIFGLMVWL